MISYASRLWTTIKPRIERKSTYSTDITDKTKFGETIATLYRAIERAQGEGRSPKRKVSSSTTSAVKKGFMDLLEIGGAAERALEVIDRCAIHAKRVQNAVAPAWPAIDKVLARVEHKSRKRKDFNNRTTVHVVSQVTTLPKATRSVLEVQKLPAFTVTEVHPALREADPWDSDAVLAETHPALRTSESKEPMAVTTEMHPALRSSAPKESEA